MATKPKRQSTSEAFKGLEKKKYSRIKQEYHDIDYVKKLNSKQKAWMSKFLFEELGANLEDAKFNISKEDRKRVFDANNARNRDIWSVHKALGRISLYTSDQDALEWWDSKEKPDIDDYDILKRPKYEKPTTQIYYNNTTDCIFSVVFNDDGTYLYKDENVEKVISRKEYVKLLQDDVIKLQFT